MAYSHEEITAIKQEVIAECKNIFVGIDFCNDKHEKINSEFAKEDKRIEIISHEFKTIKWLITTVATSSIAALVVAVMELILK